VVENGVEPPYSIGARDARNYLAGGVLPTPSAVGALSGKS